MKVVYTAGPIRSKNGPWGVHLNVQQAREIAKELWDEGFAVVCPQTNTEHMDSAGHSNVEMFLRGDKEIITRCDAVIMLPGWEESDGARKEFAFAHDIGKPVYIWPNKPERDPTGRDGIQRYCSAPSGKVVPIA